MVSTAELVLVSILLIQLPLSGIVYVDMRRFELGEFQRYDILVLLPLGGPLFLLYYLSIRNDFETKGNAS